MHPGPGLPFFSLPSFRRAGWRWAVSGCPCVASRGFSSPPARLGPAGGVEETGRMFGARELASVSLVHSWIGDPGVALLRRTPATFLSRLVLPPHLCTLGEVLGRENLWFFFLCSWLPLPPHLYTLGEVVGRVGLPSAVPVRVLPGLPIFGLGSREGTLSRSWSNGSRVRSCCSRCRSACRARFSSRDAVCGDRLVCCFPLCGRGAIVGGQRTASGFTAFALEVSVWPVAVF